MKILALYFGFLAFGISFDAAACTAETLNPGDSVCCSAGKWANWFGEGFGQCYYNSTSNPRPYQGPTDACKGCVAAPPGGGGGGPPVCLIDSCSSLGIKDDCASEFTIDECVCKPGFKRVSYSVVPASQTMPTVCTVDVAALEKEFRKSWAKKDFRLAALLGEFLNQTCPAALKRALDFVIPDAHALVCAMPPGQSCNRVIMDPTRLRLYDCEGFHNTTPGVYPWGCSGDICYPNNAGPGPIPPAAVAYCNAAQAATLGINAGYYRHFLTDADGLASLDLEYRWIPSGGGGGGGGGGSGCPAVTQRCVPDCDLKSTSLGLPVGTLVLDYTTGKCKCASGTWNGINCGGIPPTPTPTPTSTPIATPTPTETPTPTPTMTPPPIATPTPTPICAPGCVQDGIQCVKYAGCTIPDAINYLGNYSELSAIPTWAYTTLTDTEAAPERFQCVMPGSTADPSVTPPRVGCTYKGALNYDSTKTREAAPGSPDRCIFPTIRWKKKLCP